MAKKKTSGFVKYLPLLAGVLGIVAVLLFVFLPMVTMTVENSLGSGVSVYKYSGLGMIFGSDELVATYTSSGYKLSSLNGTFKTDYTYEVAFNTMAFVSFALVFVGAALTLASCFAKSLSNNKFAKLFAALVLVVGGVLMFMVKDSAITALNIGIFDELYALGIGAILGGVLACLSGVTLALSVVKK